MNRNVAENYHLRYSEETCYLNELVDCAQYSRARRRGRKITSNCNFADNAFPGGGQGQAEVTKSKGLKVDLYLLDELIQYVNNPTNKTKPLPAEFMDLDGDGDNNFDNEDLKIVQQAYWSEQPVLPKALTPDPSPNTEGGESSNSVYIWRYYHKDHLGGNTTVTDSKGDVVSSMRYHPYGQTASRTGQKPIYGFAGGEIEEEEELGLVQYGARWYAPEIGRWVSADPLFLEVSSKSVESPLESGLYSYSLSNPTNIVDISGLNGESSDGDNSDSWNLKYDAELGIDVLDEDAYEIEKNMALAAQNIRAFEDGIKAGKGLGDKDMKTYRAQAEKYANLAIQGAIDKYKDEYGENAFENIKGGAEGIKFDIFDFDDATTHRPAEDSKCLPGKCKITIGKDAFLEHASEGVASAGWLGSTIGHEIRHTKQAEELWSNAGTGEQRAEIDVYSWQIESATDFGLSKKDVAELRSRRERYILDKAVIENDRETLNKIRDKYKK